MPDRYRTYRLYAPGKTITYDFDNKPSSINSTTFVYDYSGHRVKKNSTIYIGKLYECTGSNCTKYIFAGSNRIALKTSSNSTYYYHTDHLGSSNIMTGENGTGQGNYNYYPYGGTRISSGLSIRHKFTGQELDDETGLYYYGARYYDPALGRFVSADSIVQDYSDPQTLNRYSYCRNNPIVLTDPSGHIFLIDDIIIAAATYAAANAAVIAEGAAIGAAIGGVSASATGGNVWQGALIGMGIAGGIAALGETAMYMRREMIAQSKLNPENATGESVGFKGDGFKLGGGRRIEGVDIRYQKPSVMGGIQRGPGKFFGMDYRPGSWQDYLVEAYAGPHDFSNNSLLYNAMGNAYHLTGIASYAGEAFSYTNVIMTTPIVAASVVPRSLYPMIVNFGVISHGE